MNTSIESVVKELQNFLNELYYAGYPIEPTVIDGTYDEQTRNSIRSFQNYIGLPETGIVDRETWDSLFDEYTKVLERRIAPKGIMAFPHKENYTVARGVSSDLALIIQVILRDISAHTDIGNVEITGIYDTATENEVSKFQKVSGLPVTGIVDRATWNAMVEFYNVNNVNH